MRKRILFDCSTLLAAFGSLAREMTVDWKHPVQEVAKTLLLAAVVFLPLFLLVNVAELKVRGVELSEPISYHLSGAIVIYLGLLLPVLLGAAVHGVALLLIPLDASKVTHQVAGTALAALLPLTVVIFGLAPYLSDFPASLTIATLVYGVACARWVGVRPRSDAATGRRATLRSAR